MIDASIGDHTTADARPKSAGRLITLGADQGKMGYVSVVEWFLNGEPGNDVNAVATGKLLWFGKFGEDDWGVLDELMQEWQIQFAVVDADPQINEARRFCKRFHGYAGLCRYRRGQAAKDIAIVEEDTGAPILTVDRTSPADCHARRVRIQSTSSSFFPATSWLQYRGSLEVLRPHV